MGGIDGEPVSRQPRGPRASEAPAKPIGPSASQVGLSTTSSEVVQVAADTRLRRGWMNLAARMSDQPASDLRTLLERRLAFIIPLSAVLFALVVGFVAVPQALAAPNRGGSRSQY